MPPIDPLPILGPDGAIARRLPSFEARPEQLRMAEAVAAAIDGKRHLMVEAGTGVGKSFAYLVPAIQSAVASGKKVVVSTHTISLQEQLLNKDLPFLRAVMPEEFTAVLVKGRSNYLSLRRLDVAAERADVSFARDEEFDQLDRLRVWARKSGDGSRSDLDFTPLSTVWDAVVSENDNCLGKKCPRFKDCFFFKARRRMWTANVLVVNHALFVRDLAARAAGASVLPDYEVAIFDEAHTLEEVASVGLGLKITSGQFIYLFNRLYNERTTKGLLVYHRLPDAMRRVQRLRQIAADFFADVVRWQARHGSPNGRMRAAVAWPDTLCEEMRKLATSLGRAADEIEEEAERLDLTAMQTRCDVLAAGLESWQAQSNKDCVYWIETSEGSRPSVTLASAPLEIGPTLREILFNKVSSCILTSATLSVGAPPKFDFFKTRLGLMACDTLQLGSPFDYPRQATIHIARSLPDPSENAAEFERQAIRAIPHYLEMTNGKAFVLFTSNRMLETAARELSHWFAARNIALFAQTDGMPRSKMVEAFKADVDSVIFGADSFWQGVDVPGEALSNVIIVRLPFSVPSHPLLEARLEDIRRRGGNPFVEFQVPEAVIKLKQGFGRLIRSKADRGIVVLLDPRVLTKPYGRTFLNSLPDCPRIVEDHRTG